MLSTRSTTAKLASSLFMGQQHRRAAGQCGRRKSRTIVRRSLAAAAFDADAPKRKQQKAKKKDKGGGGGGGDSSSSTGGGGRSRDLELLLAAIDAPKTEPPPVDDQELQRREDVKKVYTIGKFRQHNEENHDLAAKLRLKQHAQAMLPRNSKLKEEAMKIDDDDDGPPRWRTIPAWTPPIPGFDPNEFMTREE